MAPANITSVLGSNWAIWTNLAFLIPLYFALNNRMYLHAGFIALTMTLSFVYHFTSGRVDGTEDQMAAVALIAANAVLILTGLSKQNHYFWFWITIGTMCLALLLFYTENKYPNTHGFWHILSALVTLGCQLFFLSA